jgi:hypothetical protein
MKIVFKKSFSYNTPNLLRRCGYSEHLNRQTGEISYIRRAGRSQYPHFHIYVNEDKERHLVLNLHFDAKKPSYAGQHAHNAEYSGELVEQEAERIKEILKSL